ncbi:MAG: type IX secretion system protein PorQ [Chitinophagales bacterium]|nr:type IX secretion system protein PorQ [Chitinophagales bacterium]MDW8427420.1 type IX secretion system protein PorQ [Chitinophagales bacterium]
MKKSSGLILLLVLWRLAGTAQTGGQSVFYLLDMPASARATAMGGDFISALDDDGSLAHLNPSLLNASMNGRLSLNYTSYLTDAWIGYSGYVHHLPSWQTTLYAGLMYLDYGTFYHTDAYGNLLGTFECREYSTTVGAARLFAERFRYGMQLTWLQSRLESYTANGISAAFAASYHDTANGLTATIQFRNVGFQIDKYTSTLREPLPFDLQAGVSQRLPHTPFLLSLVFHDLHRWPFRYDDPKSSGTNVLFGDSVVKSNQLAEVAQELLTHAIIGVEVHISDVIRLSVSYHGQRRQELAYDFLPRFAGFSYGVGVRLSRLHLGYGRSIWNTAAGYHHFSLALNLADLTGLH